MELVSSSVAGKRSVRAPAPETLVPSSFGEQATAEVKVTLRVVQGELPNDLTGHALFMAPTPRGNGAPFFNAPPKCWHLSFADEHKVEAHGCLLKTPGFIADEIIEKKRKEEQLSRLRYEVLRFRDLGGISRVSWALGVQDLANTAVQPFTDASGRTHLLATYDAGQPYALDPIKLRLGAPLGQREDFLEMPIPKLSWLSEKLGERVGNAFKKVARFWAFPLISSAAHPAYDPHEKALYFPNAFLDLGAITGVSWLGGRGLKILRWDGKEVRSAEVVERDGTKVRVRQSTHQIITTRNHVVVVDTAFAYELLRIRFLKKLFPRLQTDLHTQSPVSRGWIIDKSKLQKGEPITTAVPFVVPRDCVHFWADYEETSEGRVVLHMHHLNGHDVSEWITDEDVMFGSADQHHPAHLLGFPSGPYTPPSMGRYEIDVKTGMVDVCKVKTFHDHWGLAFATTAGPVNASLEKGQRFLWMNYGGMTRELLPKRIVEAYRGRVTDIASIPEEKPSGLACYDTELVDIVDSFDAEPGTVITSVQYVPRKHASGERDAYVVAMVFTRKGRDEFWIFDAGDVGKGPVCRLSHEKLDFAFPLHAAWVEDFDASRLARAEPKMPTKPTWLSKLVSADEILAEVKELYEQK